MPVVHIASSEGKKAQKASYKRRKDQNSEINELEALLPWSEKGSGIDKISVLRLTSAYMRFKNFWQSAYQDSNTKGNSLKEAAGFEKLFSEALEGFILVLSGVGDVIYVSESVPDYVGLTQQEIIGQSIYDLTHEDDAETIKESLTPDSSHLQQHRHFYIRFKSSMTHGKKQLSKFGGTMMLQVSGKLKLSRRGAKGEPHVIGLVAECRRIESSSSILELSIPQIMFTSTTTMDLKILSIDTKMKTVTGFDSDIKGSVITNFFHPSDNKRSIHCLKTLLITGQACSPIVRFMTHTGEWVWVQIEGLIRYESDNRTPKYLEATFKVVCASDGCVKMIEQRELYGGKCAGNNLGEEIHADSRFDIPSEPKVDGAESVVKAVESTAVSDAVRDVLLHSREEALSSIPKNMNRLASWEEVMDAVIEYETSKGLQPNYATPYPLPNEDASSVILTNSGLGYPPSVSNTISTEVSSPRGSSLSPLTPSLNSEAGSPVQVQSGSKQPPSELFVEPSCASMSSDSSNSYLFQPTTTSTDSSYLEPQITPSSDSYPPPQMQSLASSISYLPLYQPTSTTSYLQQANNGMIPTLPSMSFPAAPINGLVYPNDMGFPPNFVPPPINGGVPLYNPVPMLPAGNYSIQDVPGILPMYTGHNPSNPLIINGKYEINSAPVLMPHIPPIVNNNPQESFNIQSYM